MIMKRLCKTALLGTIGLVLGGGAVTAAVARQQATLPQAPAPATSAVPMGSLVIVGGALSGDNEAVYRGFIARAKGSAPRFAIIPSASGAPADAAASFKRTLIRYGVPAAQIDVVKLAVKDDGDTPAENEATWDNASNPSEIAKINQAAAIWFTGGDQARTTLRLLKPGTGADTPMLSAIRYHEPDDDCARRQSAIPSQADGVQSRSQRHGWWTTCSGTWPWLLSWQSG
jgi:hypothetical protein